MHRAFVGNLQKPRALLGSEIALKRDGPLDVIDLALLGFALGAIGGVDFVVTQTDQCRASGISLRSA